MLLKSWVRRLLARDRDDGDNQMKEKEKDDDIVHPGNPKKTLILAQFSNSPWTRMLAYRR